MGMYFLPFLIALLSSCVCVPLIRWAAIKFWQWPKKDRDVHPGVIPRLGGVALIIVFWLVAFLDKNLIIDRPFWGLFIASIIILIFGIWDDLKNLKPRIQLAVQILLGLIIIGAGGSLNYIQNPFGGAIRLDGFIILLGIYHFSLLGGLFIVVWTVLIMNVMNWLDGLDGLASGVSSIGFAVIFLLSISAIVNQPPIAILSAILAGALIGFLIFNFPRKKGSLIFLGTSGSMFLGFMLASLSILSGSKIATAFLVLGVAILDAFWVIWQRVAARSPVFEGDHRHLHYRLLQAGLTQKQVLMMFWGVSALFGILALVSGTKGKILAIIALCAIMGLLILMVRRLTSQRRQTSKY